VESISIKNCKCFKFCSIKRCRGAVGGQKPARQGRRSVAVSTAGAPRLAKPYHQDQLHDRLEQLLR
jgi:hypothetical protein